MRTLYALAAFVLLAVPVSAQDEADVETETLRFSLEWAGARLVAQSELFRPVPGRQARMRYRTREGPECPPVDSSVGQRKEEHR